MSGASLQETLITSVHILLTYFPASVKSLFSALCHNRHVPSVSLGLLDIALVMKFTYYASFVNLFTELNHPIASAEPIVISCKLYCGDPRLVWTVASPTAVISAI